MSVKDLYSVATVGDYLFITSRRGWSLDDREVQISRDEARQLVRQIQGVLYEKVTETVE
jgi:hypothetical protein